jgi:hypothetical protein
MSDQSATRPKRRYLFLGIFILAAIFSFALTGSSASAGAPVSKPADQAGGSGIERNNPGAAGRPVRGASSAPAPGAPLGPTATPTSCTPTTIVGSITFDDAVRNGTIELDGIAATCATPKSYPGTYPGRYNYDAYTYVNTTSTTQCYTVTVDGEQCGVGLQMGVVPVTYLGSFNPNDPSVNYLADGGDYAYPIGAPVTYSFSVPAGQRFVVVLDEFYETFGCKSYTMSITGVGACPVPQGTPTTTPSAVPTVCPPQVVTGSIDDPDPFSHAGFDFTGSSNCGNPKDCPPTVEGERRYDTFTFTNPRNTEACITVRVDGTTCGESFEGVFSAAYLNSFNPQNLCENYLADPGMYSDPAFGEVNYAFVVPPNATFVIMVQEVVWPVGCQNYSITVAGLDTCLTPTTGPTGTSTPTSVSTGTSLPTFTSTAVGTAVPSSTSTAIRTSTSTRVATNTPNASVTPCAITFTDVAPTDYFYEPVRYLFCNGVISGYADNTFRPYNNTTRGQVTKIVILAFGYEVVTPATPTFTDVPANHPFYAFIETAASNGIVSGYADNTFRPYNNVTRGQLSKIVVVGAGWPLQNPPTPTFTDVPPGSPFYPFVEAAADRGIISGYADNTFRPQNDATRGQISKIVYSAVTLR